MENYNKLKIFHEQLKTKQQELNELDPKSHKSLIKKTGQELKRINLILDQTTNILQLYQEKQDLIFLQQSGIDIGSNLINIDQKINTFNEELNNILIMQDEDFADAIILEIRAGAGGDEAALFAGDLLKMYINYAEKKSWTCKITDLNSTDLNGIKSCVLYLKGHRIYEWMKLEAGVHRVQRIPATEANGRIHTSTATVAILTEDHVEDVIVDESKIIMDTFRSSGAGGQHVNKTDSGVRLTYVFTDYKGQKKTIITKCTEERSQGENRKRALQALKALILHAQHQELKSDQDLLRSKCVGSGQRNEKIRTYNWPENRITDHRFKITLKNLTSIISGQELDTLIRLTLSAYRQAILLDKFSPIIS